MKKGLFRFCVAVLIVLASVAVVDVAVGKVMDCMLPQISNQGDTGKTYYSLNDVNTPVVVVGSSRAAHHYVTQMIEDSIQMQSYNLGCDGCFFSYNCCIINSILDRYTPELIIWECDKESLYTDNPDQLEDLFPYYGVNKWITTAIETEYPKSESVKLKSNLYKFNSRIHRIIARYRGRKSFIDATEKGYLPLAQKKPLSNLELNEVKTTNIDLSTTKIERLRSVLQRAKNKGTQVVVVDSPKFIQMIGSNKSATMISKLCTENGATFYDFTQLTFFHKNVSCFNDNVHLNDKGAKIYTDIFLKTVKLNINN